MNKLFYISVGVFCAIEIYLAHLIDIAYSYVNIGWSDLVSIEFALLALIGLSAKSDRQKTALGIIVIWMVWVALTDWVPIFPGWLYSIETTLFCLLIGWILARPEHLPSYFGPNVGIAFYSGSDAPLIGRVLSLFRLPYSGVALVVDGRIMQPRKKTGKFVCTDLGKVSRNWTILETSFETTSQIETAFNNLEGKPVTTANCISAIKPILKILGYHANTPGGLALEVLNGK